MVKLVRCKVCGYVMPEDKLGDVCPVCGAFAKAFEPYTDIISPRRRKILNFHIHPIIVHFPQGLVPIFFLLSLLQFIPNQQLIDIISSTLKVLSVILPPTLLAALITGMIDAKVRFKKLKTPTIRKKIAIISLSIIVATVASIFVFINIGSSIYVVPILGALLLLNSMFLGILGSTLVCTLVKGK